MQKLIEEIKILIEETNQLSHFKIENKGNGILHISHEKTSGYFIINVNGLHLKIDYFPSFNNIYDNTKQVSVDCKNLNRVFEKVEKYLKFWVRALSELETVEIIEKHKEVFIIHGRNGQIRKDLFSFLRAIDLKPIGWPELLDSTTSGSPYIGEVLDAAFDRAKIFIVLLTPDDTVVLNKALWEKKENYIETVSMGQARPNVLFEAGMAFSRYPKTTFLVQIGKVKPFSDVGGRHIIKLDNTPRSRKLLAQRLKEHGCEVDLNSSDWLEVGDFEIHYPFDYDRNKI